MKKEKKIVPYFFIALVSIFVLTFATIMIEKSAIHAKTTSNPIHTMTFSNKVKVRTMFYPYRDPAKVRSSIAKGLQGITLDEQNNFYLTYATGDKQHYGYIYKYSNKGKLIKKSKLLRIGHGQAISYKDGYLYQLADVKGDASFTLQKININTLTVIRTWKVPSSIHPNVIGMLDSKTVIGVSKSGDGYDLNKIHLTDSQNAIRDYREKLHIKGLVGKTPGKEVQGFAIGKGQYYILSNEEYASFNFDGTNVKHISLNTNREPEGIAFNSSGKLLITFNKLNEVFIQQ